MPSRQQKRRSAASNTESPRAFLLPLLERRSAILACLLVLIASARIAATYTVFNHTTDEPAHIACGMQWLDRHVYLYEPQHPPLARVAAALGPYLLGIRSQGTPGTGLEQESLEGAAILYYGPPLRPYAGPGAAGNLPFFWLACLVVYVWGKRSYGPAVAVIALFFFSFLPPVLAHAGARHHRYGAHRLPGRGLSRRPAVGSSVPRGSAACCSARQPVWRPSRSSRAWYFFPRRQRWRWPDICFSSGPARAALISSVKDRLPSFGLAVATGALIVAAVYRFSLSALFTGIRAVETHNTEGHFAYLLGQRSSSGFWYFYPVVLAVKTPLALAAPLALALWWTYRERGRMQRDWPVWPSLRESC